MKTVTLLACACLIGVPGNQQSLLLPGSPGDYAEIDDSPSLSNLPALTAEAWIFPGLPGPASNGIENAISQYSSAAGQGPLALAYNRTNQRMRPIANYGFPGVVWFDGTVEVPISKWTHVAMTYDDGLLRLYVNGVQDSEQLGTSGSGIGETSIPWRIGNQAGSTINTFGGLVDEVRVWDVARTEQQIRNSLAGLAPGDGEGLIGYWRMEDETGSGVLLDSSAFGNHAQLFGAAKTNVADVVPKLVSTKPGRPSASLVGAAGDPMVP